MRYVRLLGVQLRLSLVLAMQYRWEFVVGGGLSALWTVIGLVPLYAAFAARPAVGGWTYDRALVVVAWFTVLKAILDGAINPSLVAVVERIRQGTLDFTLIKPADAQFLVSTAKFELWHAVDFLAAGVLFAWAFARLGHAPAPGHVALSLALLGTATVVLYSLWILVVSAAFWVVRLDNLAYFFDSLFDFARWPATIFKGVWAVLFTYVIPLAIMTTYPAEALLGSLSARAALGAVTAAVAVAAVARFIWLRALSRYRSASS